MPEEFKGDILGASQGDGESSEISQEQFQENLRRTQAAIKKIHKDEKKVTFHNLSLAQIITNLLQAGGQDDVVALIIDLVERNVPSEFILAVLSIFFKETKRQEMSPDSLLGAGSESKSIMLHKNSKNFTIFPELVQNEIEQWGEFIFNKSLDDIEKILETIVQTETWEILPSLVQLSARLLQKYLEEKNINVDFEELRMFSSTFFENLLENLQEEVTNKKLA